MNDKELFQKSFSNLHASDDTLQEVMNRAYNGRGTTGISKRFATLVAVLVMIFSMALVAHATGLLADLVAILTPAKDPAQVMDNAFGDNISTEKPKMEDAFGNPIEAPNMERPAVDLTEIEKQIGAYISDVDGVLTIGNNTFTLEQFMVDETGSGALTWTVENPNGINYGDVGYGMVYFAPKAPFDEPAMYHYGADGTKKKSTDFSTALISKSEDGTKLKLVSYFGTFDHYEIGDSFVWMVSQNHREETQKIQITPAEHIPTKTLTTADGLTLWIANHSIAFDINSDSEFLTDKIVVNFKDGSQYCIADDDAKIYNLSEAFWRQSDEYRYDDLVYLFNRLIDTNEVSSVEVAGGWTRFEVVGNYYEPVRTPETIVFYP